MRRQAGKAAGHAWRIAPGSTKERSRLLFANAAPHLLLAQARKRMSSWVGQSPELASLLVVRPPEYPHGSGPVVSQGARFFNGFFLAGTGFSFKSSSSAISDVIDVSRAAAIFWMTRRPGIRSPRSSKLTCVLWSPALSARASCPRPRASRRLRMRTPNCCWRVFTPGSQPADTRKVYRQSDVTELADSLLSAHRAGGRVAIEPSSGGRKYQAQP